MLTIEEQMERVDDIRKTDDIDYDKIHTEITEILNGRMKKQIVKEKTYSKTKCPILYKNAFSYEIDRIDEFKEILDLMIKNLKKVQKKQISQTKCTKEILTDNLDLRFLPNNI